VIQSTIPTISNRLIDFKIPILDKNSIDEITKLVKKTLKEASKNQFSGRERAKKNFFL